MRRTWSFWLLLFMAGLVFPLFGQEEPAPEEEPPAVQWDNYMPELYRAGDKIFSLSVGVIFPTVFTGSGMEGRPSRINLGGMGIVSYSYFFSPHWFFGGELEGMFAGTQGKSMVYIIPYGIHFGYQLVIGRFEFPIRIMTGFASQLYLDKNYFGWFIKPGISGFFRYSADWSFGLNVEWWMVPQWPNNGKSVLGNFLDITFSARYHF